MCYDIYDTGTPKYQLTQSIYEALCELVQTEEMNVLSEMGADVSYDNQSYYYTDKGLKLKERFEELSNRGNKMWLIDLAIVQIDNAEVHEVVYNALHNTDLAKRIGFKKLFIDKMLDGDASKYDEISQDYAYELNDAICLDSLGMIESYENVLEAHGEQASAALSLYLNLAGAIKDKVEGLKLQKEVHLILECRALLTSYDDFIYGLHVNQKFFETQERWFRIRTLELEAERKQFMNQLLLIAENNGLLMELKNEIKLLKVDT